VNVDSTTGTDSGEDEEEDGDDISTPLQTAFSSCLSKTYDTHTTENAGANDDEGGMRKLRLPCSCFQHGTLCTDCIVRKYAPKNML
jgi:hypothetical protein